MSSHRPVVSLPPEVRERLAREITEVRSEAVAGYTEVDLLIAAMKEHIEDLRSERDTLRQQVLGLQAAVDAVAEERRRLASHWMWRGTKPLRTRR